MRAVRLHGIGDVRSHDEPAPAAGAGESLVRVEAVGLCGSDLHWFDRGGIGDAVLTRPIVPGHEFAGTAMTGPYAGRTVAVDPAIPCGRCPTCLQGHRNLCPTVQFAGHGSVDGGLREVVAWPTQQLTPLPETLTAADGAMLEPLGVALHAWDLARPRVGATITVVGCGPIGLLLIQLARHFTAGSIVAVEPLEHRRAAALRYGADAAIDPRDADDPAFWSDRTDGGCDTVFETGSCDAAVRIALHAAQSGAKVALLGIPDDDRTTFPAALARRKGLSLLMVRRMKEMYERTAALVERGSIDVRSLVTSAYPLDAAGAAFSAAVGRDGLKVVIEPSR